MNTNSKMKGAGNNKGESITEENLLISQNPKGIAGIIDIPKIMITIINTFFISQTVY